MREDDPFFVRFGEVYVSSITPGIVKGWNLHTKIDANFVCIFGTVKIILYDARVESRTKGQIQEVVIGEKAFNLLQIPHGIAFSWRAEGKEGALIANCATFPYDKAEIKKIPLVGGDIPYKWK